MPRGYAQRLAERREQERINQERSRALISSFEVALLGRRGSLDGLIKRYDFPALEMEVDWHVWWEASELERQVLRVKEGLSRRYLTQVALGGRRVPAPGEAQTICMLKDAQEASHDAIVCALLYTTVRSSDRYYQWNPSVSAQDAMFRASDWAAEELMRQGVSTYSTARTWFLPERMRLQGSPQTPEEMMEVLADLTADFLERWIPVHLSVRFPERRKS